MKYAFIIIDGNIRRPVDRISSGIALRLCGSIHIQFSCAYYVHVCFPKMPNSRKGSRSLNRRYSRKRRRTFCGNQHTIETETSYASTMHMNFPEGLNSWCKWRVAEARDNLDLLFMIHLPLHEDVQAALRPVYEALSSDDLLERCIGANTQNSNESLNSCVWKFAPKHLHCGAKTVKIATYLAANIFNEGFSSILKMMNVLGIVVGLKSKEFERNTHWQRIESAEADMTPLAKQARIERQSIERSTNKFYEAEEGLLYGSGIAD